jgi:DNA helicase-2/ATP-dependent DNA helicase PcrA
VKLITGAPGAGKTNRLVSEIRDRLARGVSPYMILATTFSRQAALEISRRLDGDVPVRTIHGVAYWLIRLARQARGHKVPQVISHETSLALMERAAEELECGFVEPRQALQDMERVRAGRCSRRSLNPLVQSLIERYLQTLHAENLIDFTGILELCSQELQDPKLQIFLQDICVLVDEGQDVTPATEWPILEALLRVSSEFIVLASPSQQIYGFRGADWEKLVRRFPDDLQTETLRENHRSTPEIVHAARPLAGPDASEMRSSRTSLGIPVLAVDAMNPEMEMDYIGRQIRMWVDGFQSDGVPRNEIAILTRVHAQQNQFQIMLRNRGIPFQVVGSGKNIFEREETLAILGYLRLALDPMDYSVLESIVNYPPCGIGTRTRFQLRQDDVMHWDHLVTVLAHPASVREPVVRRVHQILDLRELFTELKRIKAPLNNLVTQVMVLSGVSEYLNSEGDFAASRALGDLVAICAEFETLGQYVEYLEGEVRRPRESNGIQLTTLHAAKGREWSAIVIPGFEEGLLPLEGAVCLST